MQMNHYSIKCFLLLTSVTCIHGSKLLSNFGIKNSHNVSLSFKAPQAPADADLQPGEAVLEEVRQLEALSVYHLQIASTSVPTWARFIVVQAHIYMHNATLGYGTQKVPTRYVTGQNVGLVHVASTGPGQFFLQNGNPFNVTALLAAVAYDKNAPVPGGCNMEFSVQTAPWLQVVAEGPMVTVTSQPARVQAPTAGLCAPSLHLRYQAFHLHLPEGDLHPETYFSYLSQMLTVTRITYNGRKVPDFGSPMQHVFSAYHGTGSVYALLVHAGPVQYAAYVPALSYSCTPPYFTDSCQQLMPTVSRVLSVVVLCVGLFVCFYGHSFFQTELFLFSALWGSFLAYVILSRQGFIESANEGVLLSALGGVIVGKASLLLWWISRSLTLSVITATLSLGSLLASVLFYASSTPLVGDNLVMRSDLNFWLGYLCAVLAVAVLVAPLPNRVNIAACSVVGAYAAVLPVAHYVGASLEYIWVNTLRRAAVPGFNMAVIDPPFQTKDMILVSVWVILAVAGFVVQYQRCGVAGSHHPTVATPPPQPPLDERRPLLYASAPALSPGSVDSVFT